MLSYPKLFDGLENDFVKNWLEVIIGRKSWVGYIGKGAINLPKIRPGVLNPLDGIRLKTVNQPTIHRLNFLYAKDYAAFDDLEIIGKGFRQMGRIETIHE